MIKVIYWLVFYFQLLSLLRSYHLNFIYNCLLLSFKNQKYAYKYMYISNNTKQNFNRLVLLFLGNFHFWGASCKNTVWNCTFYIGYFLAYLLPQLKINIGNICYQSTDPKTIFTAHTTIITYLIPHWLVYTSPHSLAVAHFPYNCRGNFQVSDSVQPHKLLFHPYSGPHRSRPSVCPSRRLGRNGLVDLHQHHEGAMLTAVSLIFLLKVVETDFTVPRQRCLPT